MSNFTQLEAGEGKHVKAWMTGVEFDANTIQQLLKAARLSVVHPYVAAMPDAHLGYGSTVGSVIPTKDAVIPAAVGVDIGCGMIYQPLDIYREDLPVDLSELRAELEKAIPNGGPGHVGSWGQYIPQRVRTNWMRNFDNFYQQFGKKFPEAKTDFGMGQLGTLGTGNHFVELTVAADTEAVGILLHSGSRGLGNKIGSFFTRAAKEYCKTNQIELPDQDLAYFPRSSEMFYEYLSAVGFAQQYAWQNRLVMLASAYEVLVRFAGFAGIGRAPVIHCHHNYLAVEEHFSESLIVTRKGAVRAGITDLGIIPGSMGAQTYIVRGLGSEDSFCSCSHGAGRKMSRTQAKKEFTVEQHAQATAGIECDKTEGTLDETPGAYKNINAVMDAQSDLVTPVYTIKQFLCVKGKSEGKKWQKTSEEKI